MIDRLALKSQLEINPNISVEELSVMHGVSEQSIRTAVRAVGKRLRKRAVLRRTYRAPRSFKILGYIIRNPETNHAVVADIFSCSREFVSQVEASARTEGII